MKWKYFISWIPGIPIAIINAFFRNTVYLQYMSELRAHQLSTMSFILFYGIYVWFILKWLKMSSAQQALQLGLIWLVLTVIFEFLFGHYVMGNPWASLLHDYNIFAGRIWVIVLIWIAISPGIIYKIQNNQ